MNKLAEIQQALKVPKSNTNSFGGYKYRSCEDILEAIKPLLGEATLTLNDEIIVPNAASARFYVMATATLTDKDGKDWRATGIAREAETKKGMDEAQITGSASSYARKYALNGLFCIDDTKDADANEYAKGPQVQEPKSSKADRRLVSEINQLTSPPEARLWWKRNEQEIMNLSPEQQEEVGEQHRQKLERLEAGDDKPGPYKYENAAQEDATVALFEVDIKGCNSEEELQAWKNRKAPMIAGLSQKRKLAVGEKYNARKLQINPAAAG